MQQVDGRVVYSATDLVGYLECQHLATLERAAVWGYLARPAHEDKVLDRIAERGKEHEKRFLESLRSEGLTVVEIEQYDDVPYEERRMRGRDDTLAAMREGADVIFQAVLFDGRRFGYADFLRRAPRPSDLGDWSYEVWDTKLARHAKASAVLQLCLYSDLVSKLQGAQPEEMHLALGGVQRETVSFRVADYAAYYPLVAREFEAFLGDGEVSPFEGTPEPVEHCGVCRWSERCRKQWRSEDDLSLVAGLSSRQRRALHTIDVTTRTGLAEPAEPLPDRLDGAGREALARIQAQAEIQVRGERLGQTISERIEPPRDREDELVPNQGLLMLPEPSAGDLFFDIEGDPFFESDEVDGIDYLFGVIEPGRSGEDGQPAFHAFWSIEDGTVTTGAERGAFEGFIDLAMDRLQSDPNLHIYHYAAYEPTSVKRLAGATARARRRSTSSCAGTCSSTSFGLRGRAFERRSRATPSSVWSRSTASTAESTCAMPMRASSSSRPGLSLGRGRNGRICSARSRATTATTASRRSICATGWKTSGWSLRVSLAT